MVTRKVMLSEKPAAALESQSSEEEAWTTSWPAVFCGVAHLSSPKYSRPSLRHPQETITLEGSVRSLTRRLITVANPLGRDKAITFSKGNTADSLNPTTGGGAVAGGESEV